MRRALKGGLVAAFLAAASAVAAQTPPLVVSDGGVSGITARTAYTVDAIKDALGGGFYAIPRTLGYEDQRFPIYEIARGNVPALWVLGHNGGTVDSVVVFAVDAATTNGVTVGMTWSQVYASRPQPRCTRGMEQETGSAFCSLPGFTNVRLVFRTNTDDLPPAEVLSHSRVESIVWRAGS